MQNTEFIQITIAFLLALAPACVWGYFFSKKNPGPRIMNLLTFISGAFFVVPLLVYKHLWQYFPWLNAFAYTHLLKDDLIGFSSITMIPLSVIVTFLIVGIIEEVAKFLAFKTALHAEIHSIDDTIELFITAALGFSFIENIIYFYNILVVRGPENLISPFIFRSLFSTFAHVLFSGMLGYYYGLSHFSEQILHQESFKNKWPIFRKITQLFHLRQNVSFQEEKLVQGFFIAAGLHALFDIFLEMNWTFLIVPYLTVGFIMLNYLLEKKEDHIALVDCKHSL